MFSSFWRKLRFTIRYWSNPPWDSGVAPPELTEFIQAHAPGSALDLGCGTGTNCLALAEAGWRVTGVDFAANAIRRARQKAKKSGLEADFHVADVTRLDLLNGPFDLILDIGCFHAIPPALQADYRSQVQRLLAPTGTYMLYAFYRQEGAGGPGVIPEEIDAFQAFLEVTRREDGTNRGERSSTWFWMRRTRTGQAGILSG
jgi:SAM-dependent methyltransferase